MALSPSLAGAITSQEISAQITKLQAQIVALQQQLQQMQATTAVWCHDFNTNLRIGDFGDEVMALNEALVKEGFTFESKVTIGGQRSFDEETASVVVGFQEKYASEILTPLGLKHGTGYVGKATREKLNKLYGCSIYPSPTPTILPTPTTSPSPSPSPTITVLSPNGGEQWEIEKTHDITWKATGVDKVKIYLGNFDSGIECISQCAPPPGYGKVCCDPCGYQLITTDISASLGKYSWTIPITQVATSKTKVAIQSTSVNGCPLDYGDNYFSIVSAATGSLLLSTSADTPIAQEVKKGTSSFAFLKANFTANNIEDIKINSLSVYTRVSYNGSASSTDLANIKLYDGGSGVQIGSTQQLNSIIGGYAIFSNLGWIIPKNSIKSLIVKADVSFNATISTAQFAIYGSAVSAAGLTSNNSIYTTGEAQSNIITIVQGGPFITVLSPNGGEQWAVGSTQTITWKTTNVPAGQPINIVSLRDYLGTEYHLLYDILNDGSQTIIVPNIPTLGCYRLYLETTVEKKSVFDYSDGCFSIVSAVTPSITVLSPNGGERWQVGKAYSITWKSNGLEQININLLSADPVNEGSYRVARLVSNLSALIGNYSWVVPEKTECLSLPCITLPEHRNHKIEIVDARYGRDSSVSKVYSDTSDAPFSIVSASTNNPPVINGIPAVPLDIKVGQSVSFSWGATDADGDNLSWSVSWGDGTGITEVCVSPNPQNKQGWTLKASHAWASAGTYTVKVTANDCRGGSSGHAFNITVNNTITVLSPNGGENWTIGKTYSIEWLMSQDANVYLYACPATADGQRDTAKYCFGLPVNSGGFAGKKDITNIYNWTIPGPGSFPGAVESGNYLIYATTVTLDQGQKGIDYDYKGPVSIIP